MLQTKHLLFIFLPALLVVGFGLFLGIIRYEPLYPKTPIDAGENADTSFHIPVNPKDPILGDKKTPLTIVAFEDFGCEQCKTLDATFQSLLKNHPKKIKIIWKGLPVTKFPVNTTLAHAYAFCATEQKQFEPFKAYAFENSDNLTADTLGTIAQKIKLNQKKLDACLESGEPETYTKNVEGLARLLNIQAVPAVFLNDTQVNPPETAEGWEALLNLSTE